VIVTAGGTQEPLDPVRVIANRSSGKQGHAIAQAALDLGAQVTLISGPVALAAPVGANRLEVQTAQQMHEAVLRSLPQADSLVMAAAVADFRPVSPATNKLKKEHGVPEIRLEHTPDILKAVAGVKNRLGWPYVTVGFAAESQALLDNAPAMQVETATRFLTSRNPDPCRSTCRPARPSSSTVRFSIMPSSVSPLPRNSV
jgi:phosphopantothenoylcysteine decarboxylase/phosphopantothenate--cysteine ligase